MDKYEQINTNTCNARKVRGKSPESENKYSHCNISSRHFSRELDAVYNRKLLQKLGVVPRRKPKRNSIGEPQTEAAEAVRR
jgi:hypothetical protein